MYIVYKDGKWVEQDGKTLSSSLTKAGLFTEKELRNFTDVEWTCIKVSPEFPLWYPTETEVRALVKLALLEEIKDAAMWMYEVGCPEIVAPTLTTQVGRIELDRIALRSMGSFLDLVGIYDRHLF